MADAGVLATTAVKAAPAQAHIRRSPMRWVVLGLLLLLLVFTLFPFFLVPIICAADRCRGRATCSSTR
jgi:hypothetical protein